MRTRQTNVVLYWVTNSIGSSLRLYREAASSAADLAVHTRPVHVPTGLSAFPFELFLPTERAVRQKFRRLLFFKRHARGGHFAALEQTAELATDLCDLVALAFVSQL